MANSRVRDMNVFAFFLFIHYDVVGMTPLFQIMKGRLREVE